MPIKFNCHQCGAKLRVPEEHIGKKARCPKCDEKCLVPETSQRAPESVAGQASDDFGSLGDFPEPAVASPVGLPPAVAGPGSDPYAVPPQKAIPTATPLPASPVASPYAAPLADVGIKSDFASMNAFAQPLYEARTMMKIWGWFTFIQGIIMCLTIFYAIFAWVFVWMGWLVKGAGEAISVGVETNNPAQIRLAAQRIATFFKILGVLAIIGLIGFGLGILGLILMLVLGGMAAFS